MEIKKISVKEFRELGYLQELNRQFLHPLGLALEITINDDSTEFISGIWDSREDLEGIIYDLANSDKERIESFKKKAQYIVDQQIERGFIRHDNLGFYIEPILD